ncbi:MAG: ABC transporter ATP-binding protein [Desulfurococcales archaeon]|nr:ABC transporter ATP-binding protein [Desulfurococcales archaeon]
MAQATVAGSSGFRESGSEVILRTENLVKRFGGIVALDNVNIEIERGKVTLLIGPNGSGKTTLANVITGFIEPDSGRVIYKNRDITNLPAHERARIGIARTFQIPKPFKNLTVLENVMVAAERNPGENPYLSALFKRRWVDFEEKLAARAFEVLRWVGLEEKWDSKASDLSGGQMKLLEIARSIIRGAELIIMDEPAAGVNPKLVHDIFERIRMLSRERGLTFLIIEHRIGLISGYIDYAYAMNMGMVISRGDPERVFNDRVVLESYLGG